MLVLAKRVCAPIDDSPLVRQLSTKNSSLSPTESDWSAQMFSDPASWSGPVNLADALVIHLIHPRSGTGSFTSTIMGLQGPSPCSLFQTVVFVTLIPEASVWLPLCPNSIPLICRKSSKPQR